MLRLYNEYITQENGGFKGMTKREKRVIKTLENMKADFEKKSNTALDEKDFCNSEFFCGKASAVGDIIHILKSDTALYFNEKTFEDTRK